MSTDEIHLKFIYLRLWEHHLWWRQLYNSDLKAPENQALKPANSAPRQVFVFERENFRRPTGQLFDNGMLGEGMPKITSGKPS
ncbi:hypothetical protein PM082_006457 [Marasmius tenuissimus]|nr:hypothetical protein PM082_006457 [Marasmius tenuissimus]